MSPLKGSAVLVLGKGLLPDFVFFLCQKEKNEGEKKSSGLAVRDMPARKCSRFKRTVRKKKSLKKLLYYLCYQN